MPNDQDTVLALFPNALIRHHPAGYQYGQLAPTTEAIWAVYQSDGLGYEPLGIGPTPSAAWRDAVPEARRRAALAKTERWVSYLLQNGFQRDPENEHHLLHPVDAELSAYVNLHTGAFHASPKLAAELAGIMDSQGNPVNG